MGDDSIKLNIILSDRNVSAEILDIQTHRFLKELRENNLVHLIEPLTNTSPKGIKGDAFTVGALLLVTLPTFLPQLLGYIQNWVSDQRKIVVEAPNGAKIEFTPKHRYDEAELVNLVNTLNKMPSTKK